MAVPGEAPDVRALEALLAFWSDAGVDAALADAPVDRLAAAPASARPRPQATSAAAPEAVPRPSPPVAQDLHAAAVGEAARAAAGAADLPALRAAVDAFQGCALRHTGSGRAMFARLPARVDVAVVAEAPEPDGEEGEAFAGPAGALVRALLRHAGLEEGALLTQTVFWRPAGGGAPSPADQAACRPFLDRLLQLARPRALLVMGDGAARGLLGLTDPILKARGAWREWRAGGGAEAVPALPTLSPAFLLARPAMRKQAWGDVLSLAARVDPSDPGR